MNKNNVLIYSLLLLAIFNEGCKKDPYINPFDQYAGTWTCTGFSSSSSARGNSSIRSSYFLGTDGKLYYSGTYPDTAGTLKSRKDTFDFQYNITTSLVNDSQLLINENYKGFKNNTVATTFNYSSTIKLIVGTTNYIYYDNSYTLAPKTITIQGFNHDSYTSYAWGRTMTKVQ